MKYGYSLFLQEHVNPKDVDYEDTRLFQIVCPECKEPVFKVSRDLNDKTANYFSHYRKDETLNKQCELRVNSIPSSTINEIVVQSRNQKLSLFLKVFQDMIWDNEFDEAKIKRVKQRYYEVQRSSIFSEIAVYFLKYGRDLCADKQRLWAMFDETIQNKLKSKGIYNSDFAMNIQKEYAYDFLNYLVAGNSKKNFLFLVNVAFVQLYYDLKRKSKIGLKDWEDVLYICFEKFFRTRNENKRIKAFQELTSQQGMSGSTGEYIDGYLLFTIQLFQYAFSILLRIPYLEIIQKKVKERGFK
jgi:hypothetical protein